jgi:hypothetical protein
LQNYFLQTASFYFHDIFIGRLYIVISEITSYNKSVIRERRYEMNEKIYCTSCGAENEAGAHFCVSCGTKLEMPVQDQNPNTESLTGDVVSNNTQSTYTYTTQPAQSAQTYYSVPEEPKKEGGYIGVAIASLVCGILSLLCCPFACCGSCCGGPNVLLAIASIVLGIIALVKAFDGKGMAITGLVCGGIALVGMIFAFALPASFTRGLMTGILGEEYNIGNMDELDDLMDDFGVYYNFS